MNLIDVAKTRYSTKEFDPARKISDAQFEQIKGLLRFSASSTNVQPWHFVIASTPGTRKRISKGTQGLYSFNEAKINDSSHVILFCAKTDVDEKYLEHVLDIEEKDGRFIDQEAKNAVHKGRSMFANMHRYDFKDVKHWAEKQVYLNFGTILLGAGVLGIDAVPIEGMDPRVLDEEFGLREKGYTAIAIIALGYHKDTDFNAKLPKSRLPEEEIFSILK